MTEFVLPDFPGISFSRVTLNMRAIDVTPLPDFPGSVFRGGFGAALRKACCAIPKQECETCLLKPSCIYHTVFETAADHVKGGSHQLSQYPRPFVLEPPLLKKKTIQPGEEFQCRLVLMGHAVQGLPYFVYALTQLGQSGIGRKRGRYDILNAETALDGPPKEIFKGSLQQFIEQPPTLSFEKIFADAGPASQIRIQFDTPTRIKFKNRLTKDLTFELLMRNILRRLSLMVEVCTGKSWQLDYRDILAHAKAVKTVRSTLQWKDWYRYSIRQQDAMKLGGFLGTIVFEGDLMPFVPFLELGRFLHVGKACTFGLGKFQISVDDEQ